MPESTKQPIHKQPKLCAYILGKVADSSVPLRIGESTIPGAKSGLFVLRDVPAGTDIFRSDPLFVVCEGHLNDICDYCFVNKHAFVSPDAHLFRNDEERDKVQVSACTGCKNVSYCSKECQTKAWKSYHKYECGMISGLSEFKKKMGSLPQTLSRLLMLIKKEAISKEDLEAVVNLENHFEERLDRFNAKYGGDADSMVLEESLLISHAVNQVVGAKLGLTMVRQLFCTLLHNCGAASAADQDRQFGTFLDLVVSMINHGCDPNAHTFFEGREVRCRALKDIPAGSEIFVNYIPSPRKDVLLRRTVLNEGMYIVCNCDKCKDETAEHLQATAKRNNPLGKLLEAQKKLEKLCMDSDDGFIRNHTIKYCLHFQNQIADLADEGYPDGNWPHHLEPMPAIYRALGNMYVTLRFAIGIEFMLKGTLHIRDRRSPAWVRELMDIAKILIVLSQADGSSTYSWVAAVRDPHKLERCHLRDVARGYLALSTIAAKSVFGLDSKFTQAVYKWAADWIQYRKEDLMESDEFQKRYKDSQAVLLEWAMMDENAGLELPSPETLVGIYRDMAIIRAQAVPKINWQIRDNQTADVDLAEGEKASADGNKAGGVDDDTTICDKIADGLKAVKLVDGGGDGKEGEQPVAEV